MCMWEPVPKLRLQRRLPLPACRIWGPVLSCRLFRRAVAPPSQPRLLTGGTPVLQHSIGRIPVSSLKRQQGAQARFVSLRLFVRCQGQRRGVEQVTQSRRAGLRYLLRGRTVGRIKKKECSFFTNKATMLLKTKGRQNEQSQFPKSKTRNSRFETRSSEQATHDSLFNRGLEVGQLALWLSLFPSVGWTAAIDFGIGGEKPPATAGQVPPGATDFDLPGALGYGGH